MVHRNDTVTQRIYGIRFPSRDEFVTQTGYGVAAELPPFLHRAFYCMYGLSFGIRNYAAQHLPVHDYDVGVSAGFRYEKSGYQLTPQETALGFNHDVAENIGPLIVARNPKYGYAAALVCIDIVSQLLSPDTGEDTQNILMGLTNGMDMLFWPAEKYAETLVRTAAPTDICPEKLLAKVDALYAKTSRRDGSFLSPQAVQSYYEEVLKRWNATRQLVPHHRYLSTDEQAFISDTLSDFISQTQNRLTDGNIVLAKDLEEQVHSHYETLRSFIARRNFIQADRELKTAWDSELLLDVNKTVYTLYVVNLIENTKRRALEYAHDVAAGIQPQGRDDYLGPLLIKISDSRDNVTRWGPKMVNICSIFRKSRIVLEESAKARSFFKARSLPTGRLECAITFLYDSLVAMVNIEKEMLRKKQELQTQHTMDYRRLEHMALLMEHFGEAIGLPF